MLFYDEYTRECANDYGTMVALLVVVVMVMPLLRSRARVLVALKKCIAFSLHTLTSSYIYMILCSIHSIQYANSTSTVNTLHRTVVVVRAHHATYVRCVRRSAYGMLARARKCRDKYDLMILHCVSVYVYVR